MTKEDDLRDLRIEEESRGRRRPVVDATTRRQRQRLLRAFRKALELGDEKLFLAAIRDLGLKDGSPEFLRAWKVWRDYRGRL